MEPVELFRDAFASFLSHQEHEAIELRWFDSTKTMTDEEFKGALSRLAEFLERQRIPNVLIDTVAFAHKPSAEFEPWRAANIIPRYNAAGVKKFAFLVPPDAAHTVENGHPPAIEAPASFPTGYFGSRQRVFSWFGEGVA